MKDFALCEEHLYT